jgi:hypothetical protein
MDPITLWLSVLNNGLQIWLIILNDIPKERRAEGWERFFAFWDTVLKMKPKGPES